MAIPVLELGQLPDVDPELIRSLNELFRILEGQFESLQVDSINLTELTAPPTFAEEGTIVRADGTSWNPGGGEGVYIYRSAAWVKLG